MRWLLIHMVVSILWCILHAPVASWLARAWLEQEGHVHLVLAVLVLAGVARSVDPVAILDRLAAPPRRSAPALALAALPPMAAAGIWHWLPLDLIPAVAAIVSLYGLAGLFLDGATWRRLAPAALLGAAMLPTTAYLDVFLGFPLRRLTAVVVAQILSGAEVTASTVLAIDGATAHVDLPCSGIRSLWSGQVVLLGAAVVWGRPVSWRFGWIALLLTALLIGANGGRILVLVGLQHVLGFPLVADVLHQPLGIAGFLASVGIALGLLRWVPAMRRVPAAPTPRGTTWTPTILATALVAALALATTVTPVTVAQPPTLTLPTHLSSIPATAEELSFAGRYGGSIRKARFDGGTVVLVASRSWLGHHSPTQCLKASGWSMVEDHPAMVGGQGVRVAAAARGGAEATAVWWYQSRDRQTDDHTVRVLASLGSDDPWVLVSVLLDGDAPLDAPGVAPLIDELRASVARSLEIL